MREIDERDTYAIVVVDENPDHDDEEEDGGANERHPKASEGRVRQRDGVGHGTGKLL